MKTIIFVILFISYHLAFTQDMSYAKQLIDTLSSPYFSGRGYNDMGHKKASEYIANQLKLNKVAPIKKTYFQDFSFSTTTIIGNPELSVDNKKIVPAKEFVYWPSSHSLKGTYNLIYLNEENASSLFTLNLSETFIVIDTNIRKHEKLKDLANYLAYVNPLKAKGIILVEKKITQVHRDEPINYVLAEVTADVFPANAKNITVSVESKFVKNEKVRNVCGFIPGTSDSTIVFTAHYDHVGTFGNNHFPGANDNASGVSMLLTLSKYYAEIKPKYSLVFLFLTGEEIGLKGSEYFSENPLIDLKKIKFLFNLDMIGTGDEGFTVVNATKFEKEFNLLDSLNNISANPLKIKKRGETQNSDHYHFYKKGVPAFFIYTQGGSKGYHDITDTSNNLSLIAYPWLFKMLVAFIEND